MKAPETDAQINGFFSTGQTLGACVHSCKHTAKRSHGGVRNNPVKWRVTANLARFRWSKSFSQSRYSHPWFVPFGSGKAVHLGLKSLAAFVLSTVIASVANAQTVIDIAVPAKTTKTVTKAMGVVRPLQSSSNVYGTLIIEAGAVIEFPEGGDLNLQWGGLIDIRGTAAEPVQLRPSGNTWRGIRNNYRLSATKGTLMATHTNFIGVTSVWGGAISLTHAQVLLDNCTIFMSRTDSSGKQQGCIQFLGYPTTGLISNCTCKGATTGILDQGTTVKVIDFVAEDVVTPFHWQPSVPNKHFYHKISVQR